jgi:plasminogen activator inhibitor 1 RNA-binding protein
MTLEEYEKIREESRKALLALKTEERKVEIDKDLQSMQLLSTKKSTEEVFIKLVSIQKDFHFHSCSKFYSSNIVFFG